MRQVISVHRDVNQQCRQNADAFRRAMADKGILIVNLVSSPGAGKTSLLISMAQHWQGRFTMAVLVGDIATERDAERLAPFVPVVQLTTGGACHLEFPLVARGWETLACAKLDFLFIENVGNLVCPSSHDLGEHLRAVLLSTTEGDDKPGKYPKAFRTSRAMLLTKTDLLKYVPFSVARAEADARRIQPKLLSYPVCSLAGEGVSEWCRFLETERARMQDGNVPLCASSG
jgi:hydrogenase nickel incorporation protein HypB